MSYILEALRRAEIERERKRRVPGLHTQPVAVPTEERTAARSKVWLWIVLGVAAGVLLPVLWGWWSDDPDTEVASTRGTTAAGHVTPGAAATVEPPRPAPATAPVATEPAPAPAPAPTPPAAAPPEPRRTSPPAAAPAARTAAKSPTSTAASATAPAPAKPGGADTPSAKPSPAPQAPVAAAPVAPAPETRLRSLAELPEDLRRNVPPLSFGGSVYSEIAAQRMVILNGQVLREGESLGDDLVIEQIRPRSAVLRVRGQRFEVPF